ncbi:MAG: hypothetical protein ABII25_03610 [bacterium]
MGNLVFSVNPFLLFLIGLIVGYIIKLFIPEDIFHKNLNKNLEVFDNYYCGLKGKNVKELTAREYQHLSMLKKIEFEKKYPQKADSKIAIPISKVFTIHSVLPSVHSKPKIKLTTIFSLVVVFAIAFYCIFLI